MGDMGCNHTTELQHMYNACLTKVLSCVVIMAMLPM